MKQSTDNTTPARRFGRLARIITVGALVAGATVTAVPTAASASSTSHTGWKGRCEVVAWAPYTARASYGYRTYFPAKMKCNANYLVKQAGSIGYTDKSWAPDKVNTGRSWHNFVARANTWYNIGSWCYTNDQVRATRHTTGLLRLDGWWSTLSVESPRSSTWGCL